MLFIKATPKQGTWNIFELQWNVTKWNVLQCVGDGLNWSHQANAREESGLAATVATGLTCPLPTVQYMRYSVEDINQTCMTQNISQMLKN